MKTMRNTLTLIALLLLVSACGQSEQGVRLLQRSTN